MNLDQIVEKFNASVVGGKIIAFVDGVHHDLGVVANDIVTLTEKGEELVASAVETVEEVVEKPFKKKPKADDAPAETPAAE